MATTIEFNFLHELGGTVWQTLVSPENEALLLEVRKPDQKQVTFSALHYGTGEFFWRDVAFDEPWWISLGATTGNTVLFTVFLDTDNPDKKGVMAYDLHTQELRWWNNDLSLAGIYGDYVLGTASRYGHRQVVLDVATGKEVTPPVMPPTTTNPVVRPQQYEAGTPYFETVKTFLEQKFNLTPVSSLEYLEHDALIFISCYTMEKELANYLLICSADGKVLLTEKLGGQLKGIGLDTFFILAGCVFFVKNKEALVSYKIV